MIEILNGIVNFFRNAGSFLGVDLITIITFSLTVVVFFIAALTSHFSIESVTNKKVKQINSYLLNNPFITDENIVEFNRIMKHRMPKAMRYQWQRYMVNRDEKPSKYLSEDNCITKPFRTSGFLQAMKQAKYFVGLISILSFALILGSYYSADYNLTRVILSASVTPLVTVGAGILFISLMTAKRNAVLSDLFYNFDAMQHSIDRAVVSFPAFVDYEILFTRKEISAGIPALQEYLQQRAQYEQEQLEKARLSQVEHEEYDFSKLGVKGTLIMDRAMKECEFYLGNRKTLNADIDSLQTQKDLLSKNFDEKNRANQRKLRDIKETIDRLREKLNTTTNKIVGNDIIKQQADEVKKQQLVEKEMDDDNNHYLDDVKKLDDQIAFKKKEIEDNRKLVETTLINDFKDYSDKIYNELKKIADSNVIEELNTLRATKDSLEKELEDRERYIVQKNAMYDEKIKENESFGDLKVVIDELNNQLEVKDQEIFAANKTVESRELEIGSLKNEVDRLKKEKYHEVYRYFDNSGVEFFYDEKGKPFYFDNDGGIQYFEDADKVQNLEASKQIENELMEQEKEEVTPQSVEQSQEIVEQPQEAPVENEILADNDLDASELSALEDLLNDDTSNEQKPEVEQEKLDAVEQPKVEPNEQIKEDEESASAGELSESELNALQELFGEGEMEEPAKEVKEDVVAEPVVEPKVDNTDQSKNLEEVKPENVEQIDKDIEQQTLELEKLSNQLAEQLKEVEKEAEKPVVVEKAPAKKQVAKKTAPKKSTAKKTATKKPATKKPEAKKTTAKKPVAKTAVKKASAGTKSKPKAKKDYVFKVKKAPKVLNDNSFKVTNFNSAFENKDGRDGK